jgi:hypothetical protein
MSVEVGVLLAWDAKQFAIPIFWHFPEGRNAAYLPDSRTLWDEIWNNRERVLGFAHSHPGSGIPGPSYEDLTTFAAVESALGKRLFWWITNSDVLVRIFWIGPNKLDYHVTLVYDKPVWLSRLRQESEYL